MAKILGGIIALIMLISGIVLIVVSNQDTDNYCKTVDGECVFTGTRTPTCNSKFFSGAIGIPVVMFSTVALLIIIGFGIAEQVNKR